MNGHVTSPKLSGAPSALPARLDGSPRLLDEREALSGARVAAPVRVEPPHQLQVPLPARLAARQPLQPKAAPGVLHSAGGSSEHRRHESVQRAIDVDDAAARPCVAAAGPTAAAAAAATAPAAAPAAAPSPSAAPTAPARLALALAAGRLGKVR